MKKLFDIIEKANNLMKLVTLVISIVVLYFGLKMDDRDMKSDIRDLKTLYEQDKQFQAYRATIQQQGIDEMKRRIDKNTEIIGLLNQQIAFLRPDETSVRRRNIR